jgi:hypothetical protein
MILRTNHNPRFRDEISLKTMSKKEKDKNFKYLLHPTFRYIFVILSALLFFVITRTLFKYIQAYKESNLNYISEKLYYNDGKVKRAVVPVIKYKSCQTNLKGSESGDNCDNSIRRLGEYCRGENKNKNEQFLVTPRNDEGRTFLNNDNYILKHVVFTVRHGDRSSIHNMPGSNDSPKGENNFDFAPGILPQNDENYLDIRAISYHHRLSSFKLNILNGTSKFIEKRREMKLLNSINNIFSVSDFMLSPGQLTSLGFMQLVEVGKVFQEAYGELVNKLMKLKYDKQKEDVNWNYRSPNINDYIYIRSTNYERTIQSTTGLLSTFLSDLLGPNNKLNINIFYDEMDEIMHGVGLRQSSHSVQEGNKSGEELLNGKCNFAAELGRKQRESFNTSNSVINLLVNIFDDESIKTRFITELVDTSITKVCHNQQLPCNINNPGKCLNEKLLANMMEDADKAFCNAYVGKNGGEISTLLSTYPFMIEILNNLLHAVSSSNLSSKYMNVYIGHDTVISPVLAALGIFKHAKYCKWPPYASRIVFELWQNKNKTGQKEYSFIRVIYNGDDVTSLIPSCSQYNKDGPLCPIILFEKQIHDMLGDKSSLIEACNSSE